MAKIKLYPSLEVSRQVLRAVEKIMPAITAEDCDVQVMSNCREQAFVITHHVTKRQVAFCECRNSDNIVVYYGDVGDFSYTSNMPASDKAWQQQRQFSYGETIRAASWIVRFLQKEVNE